MALTNVSTKSINDTIIAQLQASLSQTIPLLPKSFSRVLAKVFAAVFVILYKYGGFIALQQFVQTASAKATEINGVQVVPLTFWGRLVGVGDPTSATSAELNIGITVLSQGGTLPAGAKLVGPTNGVTYTLLSSVLLDAPVVSGLVRAVSDQSGTGGRGVQGNLDPGATLSFANPPPDVSSSATVDSQAVTAANAEATEVYRQRVLDRFQKPPQGGAPSDYELWSEEVEGIINAYPYKGDPGEVNVYCEATEASSGSADGVPTGAQITAIEDSIQFEDSGLASRRPAGAFVNVLPIIRTGFDVRVAGLSNVSNVAQVQSDIEDALSDYFWSVEPFIPGLSVPPRNDILTQTRVSATVEDIVTAAGGTFNVAQFYATGGSGSLTTRALVEGEKAKLVNVVFA